MGDFYNGDLWGKSLSFVGSSWNFVSDYIKKRWHTSCQFQIEITSNKKVIARKPLTNLYEMNSTSYAKAIAIISSFIQVSSMYTIIFTNRIYHSEIMHIATLNIRVIRDYNLQISWLIKHTQAYELKESWTTVHLCHCKKIITLDPVYLKKQCVMSENEVLMTWSYPDTGQYIDNEMTNITFITGSP